MAEANRDDNRVPVLLGASSVDGTPIEAIANPVNGRLGIYVTIQPRAITVGTVGVRDDNRVPVTLAARSDNGEPMPIHSTPGGLLLIDLNLI